LVARAGVSLAGSAIFLIRPDQAGWLRWFRVRGPVLREFLLISPATALGGLGYAVMSHSETAVAAIFVRPEVAAVLNLTRKALDVGHGLVNVIAFASYGGFAHLTASEQRHRTLAVHAEISSLRLSLAVSLAAAYMAVNASLVAVWVGADQYGGMLLTGLLALQFIVSGQSFLMNYLYRAVGRVQQGSLLLAAESLVRIPAMIGLLLWLGLPGIPLAGLATGAVFGGLAYYWTLRAVAGYADPRPAAPGRLTIIRVGLLALGAALGALVRVEQWVFVIVTGGLLAAIGGVLLLGADPLMQTVRSAVLTGLRRSPVGRLMARA
jgi:hypothetical protein